MAEEFKSQSRRDVPLGKRDRCALNALNMLYLKNIQEAMQCLVSSMEEVGDEADEDYEEEAEVLVGELLNMWNNVVRIEPLPARARAPRTPAETIADFEAMEGLRGFEFSSFFRFNNGEQLRRLIRGFQLPDWVTVERHR